MTLFAEDTFGCDGDSSFGREGTDEDIGAMTKWKRVTIQL